MVLTRWQFGLSDDAGEVELAEFGTWQQFDSGNSPSDWNAGLQGLAQKAYEVWVARATTSWWSGFIHLDSVKTAHFNTAGHTLEEQTYAASSLWAGTASGASLPWQVSLCVSLYGYQPGQFATNARSKRGRVYLPPMATALIANNANGELDSSHVSQAMALLRNMVIDLGGYTMPTAPTGTSAAVSVFSRKLQTTFPVTWIACDNKWDTQRRRVNRLDTVRQSVVV
jgi:hypothetical protein